MDYNLIIIIAITTLTTIKGFNDINFYERYKFSIGDILQKNQWDRLITNGFLHVDWMHLIFNMITLFFFADIIILRDYGDYYTISGKLLFLIIYFTSLIGSSLITLFFHRLETYYSAVGASGAVSGILFAAIVIEPSVNIFFMPGAVYGLLYLGYSIWGMQNNIGNIGHTAHIGGAIIGILIPIIVQPSLFTDNQVYISLLFIPIIIMSILAIKQK